MHDTQKVWRIRTCLLTTHARDTRAITQTTDKDLGFYEFASLFGFSEGEADEAEQAAAAVRIQAMNRKKQGAAVAVERKRRVLESADASAYTARL